MMDLSSRQISILRSLIEEYIESAKPVGSERLEKKYSLGVSPATIRNEMAELTKMGYLKKDHLSAGRSPTSIGLKYYVRHLIKPNKLSVSDEVRVKEKVWPHRNEFDKLLREALRVLSDRSHGMALATDNSGNLYFYGASRLLDQPEFFDIDVTRTLLSLVDENDYWFDLVRKSKGALLDEAFCLLVGEDLGMKYLEPCSLVYQTYHVGPYEGVMGVLGPARQQYQEIIPWIDYFVDLVTHISK